MHRKTTNISHFHCSDDLLGICVPMPTVDHKNSFFLFPSLLDDWHHLFEAEVLLNRLLSQFSFQFRFRTTVTLEISVYVRHKQQKDSPSLEEKELHPQCVFFVIRYILFQAR